MDYENRNRKEARSGDGKRALVLSGGGSRGAYQCGVWQAMEELGMGIDIVAGVSVGAINGAMVVQGDVIKTANLWRQMETLSLIHIWNMWSTSSSGMMRTFPPSLRARI